MPYEITQGTIILTRFFGVLTADDLLRLAVEAEVLEATGGDVLDRVSDLTEVERFDLKFPDMLTFGVNRRTRKIPGPVKSAIIATDPVAIGFARMFQTINTHVHIEIRIVNDRQEAEDWFASRSPRGDSRS